jgi:hypothetical protein
MLSYRRRALWCGAVALAPASAGVLVGGCGALGNSADLSGGVPSPDSGFVSDGGPDGTVPPFEGGPDAGSAPTTALFVQASPSLPDVRLCWTVDDGGEPRVVPFPGVGAMPGSNYPGVPLGGVAAMDDASSLVGVGLTLYAVDAKNLAQNELGQSTPATCDALICGQATNPSPPCLGYNSGYWPVATVTGPGVQRSRDNVVALTGCLPTALDPGASTARCGASWNAVAGNLHADVLQLLPTAAAGSTTVQAAQLSPGLVTLEGDGGATMVSFGTQGAIDASEVATLQREGDLSTPALVAIGPGLPVYGEVGFAVDVAPFDGSAADGSAGHLWMSLADALQLVDPTADPTQFFGQARPYLVAVLGDPQAPHAFASPAGDAGYDGKGLHVLVIAAPAPEGGLADAR